MRKAGQPWTGRPASRHVAICSYVAILLLVARRIAPDVLPPGTLVGEVKVLDPILHPMVPGCPVHIRIAGKLSTEHTHFLDKCYPLVLVRLAHLLVEQLFHTGRSIVFPSPSSDPLGSGAADVTGEDGIGVVHEDAASLNGELVVTGPAGVEAGAALHDF